jgi:hypothetical protein
VLAKPGMAAFTCLLTMVDAGFLMLIPGQDAERGIVVRAVGDA